MIRSGICSRRHEAVNDWECGLNSETGAKTCQITVALFDFSKAFDRVCHKRLLLKLDCYGFRGPMREWIDSYLQDRTQTVSMQGVKSSSTPVVSGVPQCSVLGPLLFLLIINDIDNNIQSLLRLFADDTILYREMWSKDDHNIIQNYIQTLFKGALYRIQILCRRYTFWSYPAGGHCI